MYSFFGIPTSLEINNIKYKSRLLNELSFYELKNEVSTKPLIISDDWSLVEENMISRNPSIHFYKNNAIIIKDKLMDIAFLFSNDKKLEKILFKLNYTKSKFRSFLRKWLNMQFTNRIENIGQIFHELVLVPITFFQPDLVPIHASGMFVNSKGILLGGTGGVGKTSLEIDFCLNGNSFITDDIAIANTVGAIFPNYNYPKIYGYNLEGNPKLKKRLFKNQGVLDSLHWVLHKTIFGIDKVRRKKSAQDLYTKVVSESISFSNYFVLFKKNVKDLNCESLNVDKAVEMSLEVILSEYSAFFNHLKWHNFNAIGSGMDPIITCNTIENKWRYNLYKLLTDKDVKQVNIPFNIEHSKFKSEMKDLIMSELKINE